MAQTIEFSKFGANGKIVNIKRITAMSSGAGGAISATQIQYENEIDLNVPPLNYESDIEIEISYLDTENNPYEAIIKSDQNYNDGFRIIKQRKIS